jgi:hypothetical protein
MAIIGFSQAWLDDADQYGGQKFHHDIFQCIISWLICFGLGVALLFMKNYKFLGKAFIFLSMTNATITIFNMFPG